MSAIFCHVVMKNVKKSSAHGAELVAPSMFTTGTQISTRYCGAKLRKHLYTVIQFALKVYFVGDHCTVYLHCTERMNQRHYMTN